MAREPDGIDPRNQTERLAALGTLVASVAHEVNNPITYVLGNLGELERVVASLGQALDVYRDADAVPREVHRDAQSKLSEVGGPELLAELFADTREGALRIRDLVRDLLQLARPLNDGTPLVNAHDVLDSTLSLVGRRLSVVATLERDYLATRWVHADRAKLGGVFLNLISNAIQACLPPDPERQTIWVRTRDRDGNVEIEIEDTGVGIDSENRDAIFTPFFTTKEDGEGNGLGLFISRNLVEQCGGSIDFRTGRDGGTIFSVLLPGHEDEPPGKIEL